MYVCILLVFVLYIQILHHIYYMLTYIIHINNSKLYSIILFFNKLDNVYVDDFEQ